MSNQNDEYTGEVVQRMEEMPREEQRYYEKRRREKERKEGKEGMDTMQQSYGRKRGKKRARVRLKDRERERERECKAAPNNGNSLTHLVLTNMRTLTARGVLTAKSLFRSYLNIFCPCHQKAAAKADC